MDQCIVGYNLQPPDVHSMALCQTCEQDKLIAKPSSWKFLHELPPMILRLHGDICGSMYSMFGPFRYFLI